MNCLTLKLINMSGWIKIHRSILDWEWYEDTNTFRLFIHLILKANHKDKNYKGKLIKRGCLVTGRDLLSVETGLSVRQIRTCLERLKSTNEIAIKTGSKGTEIQIVKYEEYQLATSETTNKRPTNDQQTTTNKNVKKEKNEKNTIPTLEEFIAYGIENKPKADKEQLRLKYNAWLENGWCTNRKGVNSEIKNWKSTLSNTLPYISETKTSDDFYKISM